MKNRIFRIRKGFSDMSEESEWEAITNLVREAASGDEDALFALCQVTAKSILFRVMRVMPDRMDAEDTAQEVLIRVCKNINTLRAPEAFGGWLNKIIINETNRYMAKKSNYSASIINIEDYTGEIPEDNEDFLPHEYAVRKEDRGDVMEVIDKLPKRQLEAIMLHYYEGMSVNEVAAAMGITASGVSRYLMLARDKIKNGLEKRSGVASYARSLTFLPVGQLLMQVLGEESGRLLFSDGAWLEQAMGKCAELIPHASAAAAGAGTVASGVAAGVSGTAAAIVKPLGIVGSLVATATVTVTVTIVSTQSPASEPAVIPVVTEAEGRVAFIGGEHGYEHLNPKSAKIESGSEYGELNVLDWAIMPIDGGEVMLSGQGEDAAEAFETLLADGHTGEYLIVFSLEDAFGGIYRLSRSFYLMSDEMS